MEGHNQEIRSEKARKEKIKENDKQRWKGEERKMEKRAEMLHP